MENQTTFETIQTASPEEIAAMNKRLTKTIVKYIVLKTTVTVGIILVAREIGKRLENSSDQNSND